MSYPRQTIPIGGKEIRFSNGVGGFYTVNNDYNQGSNAQMVEGFSVVIPASSGGGNVRYGTTAPSVLGTDVKGDTYIQTSTGTNGGTLMNTWTYDGAVWYLDSQVVNTTRAQLLALRTAGNLRQSQHYLITDHVQGQLVAGTTILTHAVSNTELSQSVSVNTTYDNEGWFGIYDIDLAVVTELRDNRNNVVRGINGTQVAQFDWGNTSYTNVTVDNATLTADIGNTAVKLNTTIEKGAVVNLTGFTGSIVGSTITAGSNIDLSGSNFSWQNSIFQTAFLNGLNYTGGGTSANNYISGGNINVSAMTGQFTINSSYMRTSTITSSGLTTALTISGSEIHSSSLSRSVGANTVFIDRTNIVNNSIVTNTTGTMTLVNSTLDNGSTVTTNTNATSVITLSGTVVNQSQVTNSSAASTSLVNSHILNNSTVLQQNGSLVGMSLGSVQVHASNITRTSTATAGNFSLSNVKLSETSTITKGHTGGLTFTSSHLTAGTTISATSGDRSYAFSSLDAASAGIGLTGTGAVTDNITGLSIDARGSFIITCSGAANNITSANISGQSGLIQYAGTTGGKTGSRLRAINGNIAFNNSPNAANYLVIDATSGSVINFGDNTAADVFSNVKASESSSITVALTPGTAATRQRIHAANGSSITLNATTGAINGMWAENGPIISNTGTHSNVVKKLSGTLTLNVGNQVNILHQSFTNKTTTVANTSRADYFGIAAGSQTAPIL